MFVLFLPLSSHASKILRPPHAAGTFYPKDPNTLYSTIKTLLDEQPPLTIPGVRTILVPHAGLNYSGKTAADSFREVQKDFDRVFVIASNHNGKVDFEGLSIPRVTHYEIPGAQIPLSSVVLELFKHPLFKSIPEAHTMHMIEVELPFLYHLKGHPDAPQFTLIPIIAGRMSVNQIHDFAGLLAKYDNGKTLFVFSVDLSHYYTFDDAKKLDHYTIEALKERDTEKLAKATTDANQVLMVLSEFARLRNLWPTFVSETNSGEVTNTKERVVGYASMLFHPKPTFTESEKSSLLAFTVASVQHAIHKAKVATPSPQLLSDLPLLRSKRAAFVTLNQNNKLRGCMGYTFPTTTLGQAIAESAFNASLKDARFNPVTTNEFDALTISLSILDYPQRVVTRSATDLVKQLIPHVDGVIIKYQNRQSLFLPQVWNTIPNPTEFLSQLCLKQGSPTLCWQEAEAKIYRFETVTIGK